MRTGISYVNNKQKTYRPRLSYLNSTIVQYMLYAFYMSLCIKHELKKILFVKMSVINNTEYELKFFYNYRIIIKISAPCMVGILI